MLNHIINTEFQEILWWLIDVITLRGEPGSSLLTLKTVEACT
ncbi:hypothetical protein KPK_4372 [Klebsiella variicola]|uniref:Uncharacterized protein n=1 Tax=Klebsiella variicola (strain 342) TaxID=507522 RepID=B5Y131_KLEV3|nr:hypothetical protein KPK_4372 [Klebsiella variicola]EGF62173.1 hypothetical protein HMPREF9538_03412 [Klebsiella sp. MS 92-3]